VKIIIHRGSKEIGGSCVELKTDRSRILLDFGMPLVDDRKGRFDSMKIIGKSTKDHKMARILPNIQGLYKGERKSIDAVLISHSHPDHYGLLNYVRPDIPIHLSEGAKQLIEISNIFTLSKVGKLNTGIIGNKRVFKIGEFIITPYLVDHSAFDALAFLIEANGKRVFYSGDFRGHGRKSALFKQIIANPPKDIDCLIMEGTALGRENQAYKDEEEVQARIENILKNNNCISFLFTSSQNIDRLVSAYKACIRTDSMFVIDLYTAFVLERLRRISRNIPQFNWKGIRVMLQGRYGKVLIKAGYRDMLDRYDKRRIDMYDICLRKNKTLMLARDNFGFRNIATNYDVSLGSKIIYSMWDGYLSDEFKEFCRSNKLSIEHVHTSGHATMSNLKQFAKAMNPKSLIPIHTFHRSKYKEHFKNVKVLTNGKVLSI